VRVIGGFLRSRTLVRPPDGVRPTADRVREALFASLGSLEDARVLDLFAGTGALGIEALSRGAASAVFIDKSERSLRALRQNLKELGLEDQSRVVRRAVRPGLRQLEGAAGPFDLALLDPPYAIGDLQQVLEELVASGLMASEGTVVVETGKSHSLAPVKGLVEIGERLYGDTRITRLRCQETDSDPASSD
jgi:16S rRNA (guanine966-N2)-methyltransferase